MTTLRRVAPAGMLRHLHVVAVPDSPIKASREAQAEQPPRSPEADVRPAVALTGSRASDNAEPILWAGRSDKSDKSDKSDRAHGIQSAVRFCIFIAHGCVFCWLAWHIAQSRYCEQCRTDKYGCVRMCTEEGHMVQ